MRVLVRRDLRPDPLRLSSRLSRAADDDASTTITPSLEDGGITSGLAETPGGRDSRLG